ncbi:MAG: hypothetical protein NXI10_12745 [bacterium]|nr:hypothetical protein [bacterium]
MKKDLIDTIMEKDFQALTDVEREELKSYCASEEEYNQMKDVFLGMEKMTWENPKPKAETKQRLDELFDATYPKAAPVWYNSVFAVVVPKEKPIHRQPLAQIAAIALVALLFIPFWKSNTELERTNSSEQVAQVAPSVNEKKNTEVTAKPVKETKQVPSVTQELPSTRAKDMDVLVASAEPSTQPASSGTSVSGAGSEHPDGVFIAVSQPASESPEMFDLLTATF